MGGEILAFGILILFVHIFRWMAGRRGANEAFWGVVGGTLGPLALPFLLFSNSALHEMRGEDKKLKIRKL